MLDLCRFLSWFRPEHFYTTRSNIMYYWQWFEIKNILMMDLFLLSSQDDGLEWCGLLVDYCDVFISCSDSHSDGTHSLQSIHCWDSDECHISPNSKFSPFETLGFLVSSFMCCFSFQQGRQKRLFKHRPVSPLFEWSKHFFPLISFNILHVSWFLAHFSLLDSVFI